MLGEAVPGWLEMLGVSSGVGMSAGYARGRADFPSAPLSLLVWVFYVPFGTHPCIDMHGSVAKQRRLRR